MTRTADFMVIGGGVVGLAIARELLLGSPNSKLIVVEKEQRLGQHASGRNSGVLHAGFYYSPDSLKAQLTRRGNELLHEFCNQHSIPVRKCGKVVVSRSVTELARLDDLYQRGTANGVQLEYLDEASLHRLEPLARTVERALWSPTTSVADPSLVVAALAADVRQLGGRIMTDTQLLGRRGDVLMTADDTWQVGHVINAAGLYADKVADWFGFCDDYALLPFKGLYWYSSWPAGRLTRHVYPVPDPLNPFLGVHLTVTPDGGCKIGPTAIPATRREDYGHFPSFKRGESSDIARLYPRFLRSEHHNAVELIRSEVPKYNRRTLIKQARGLVPSVNPSDFRLRGKPGVRAQMFHLPTGKLEMDFIVRGDQRSTHILNAVSPAWTSSLAVAQHVVGEIMPTHNC